MKPIRIFLIILFSAFFLENTTQAQGLRKVIIDAGHGGKDPGAIGASGIKEKTIVLSIAKLAGSYIEKNYPDVEVIYTRSTDVFLELHERSAIANNNNADLFISIHANSASNADAHGTETYVLGLHKSDANLDVAKRENAVIELEDNYDQHYSFNPNSPEGHIMMSMAQNAYLDQSIFLASQVQDQFESRVQRHNRGVRQAGFYVLYKTTMPSILIELGFLSNPDEEKFLNSAAGQEYMASAIYRAVKDYKTYVDDLWLENEKNKLVKASTNDESFVAKDSGGRIFKIQVYASKIRAASDAKIYKDFQKVLVEQSSNGIYRYVVNEYSAYKSAAADLVNVAAKGYQGAYIVAYKGGVRVPVYDITSTN